MTLFRGRRLSAVYNFRHVKISLLANSRYEALEAQDPEQAVYHKTGTPPPLPARQNYQTPPSSTKVTPKKDKESLYSTGKQYTDRHNHENYYMKESNYMSPRVMQDRHENYQRHENVHRTQEPHVSINYVKLQKEKYDMKAESLYASQREIKSELQHAHQKLTASNSLPLAQNSTYSLPKSNSNNNLVKYEEKNKHESDLRVDIQGNERIKDDGDIGRETTRYDLPHEFKDFKLGDKVTCLKTTMSERPVPHKVIIDKQKDLYASSLPPESARSNDGNCTDISTLPSEDELSNGSGNVSPRLRRSNKHRGGNLTPSSGNSRNQSPRPKAGVRNSHRNSANLTSSTLQEDLMKLINPDYIVDDTRTINNNVANNVTPTNHNHSNTNKLNNNNNTIEIQNRCRSRENLCGSSATTLTVMPSNCQDNGNNGSEVILTMARPATVISNTSTASSPALSENKMSKEERYLSIIYS